MSRTSPLHESFQSLLAKSAGGKGRTASPSKDTGGVDQPGPTEEARDTQGKQEGEGESVEESGSSVNKVTGRKRRRWDAPASTAVSGPTGEVPASVSGGGGSSDGGDQSTPTPYQRALAEMKAAQLRISG